MIDPSAVITQLDAPPKIVFVMIPGKMPVGGVAKFEKDRDFLLKFYALNQYNEYTMTCFVSPMAAERVARIRQYPHSKYYIGPISYDDLHAMTKLIKAHAYVQAIQVCDPKPLADGQVYNSEHRRYWIDTKEELSDVCTGA